MADNTNKVTIDAAWFIELFRGSKEKNQTLEAAYNQVRMERDKLFKELNIDAKKIAELANERDELKAKLDGDATANGLSPATMRLLDTEKRLAAAERCIEDIAETVSRSHTEMRVDYAKIEEIIRAYREKKEAVQ